MPKDIENAANGQDKDERETIKHNVGARKDAINKALEEMYQCDRRIEVALEKHVTPHREDKQAIKKRLREDYQLTTKLVNARYGIYKAERDAQENGDDTTLDVLRELFESAPVGTTLDIEAGLPEEARGSNPPATPENKPKRGGRKKKAEAQPEA